MALEIRRGVVTDLRAQGEAIGRGGRQSVAHFKLDDILSKYVVGSLSWGDDPKFPDFRNDDEIVACGEISNGKVFSISSIYVDRLNLISGASYSLKLLIGVIVVFVGCKLSIIGYRRGIMTGQGVSGTYITAFICILFGIIFVNHAVKIYLSRRMIAKYVRCTYKKTH